MYFEMATKRRLYSVYTWSFIVGRCVTNCVTKKNNATKHKQRPATDEWSDLHEGIVQQWKMGPPFFSQLKRLIVNLRGIRYEPIQHLF